MENMHIFGSFFFFEENTFTRFNNLPYIGSLSNVFESILLNF